MRALIRNMPWSLWWFVLTGVLYLLQAFPVTGVFLMLVAAAVWSVVTVNLGFLCLAVEALTRRINPAWLALPALWFGGYAIAAHVSEQRVAALDAEYRAQNAAQRVSFDPAAEALVFGKRSYGLSGAPGHLVQNYRLLVAYDENANYKTAQHVASRVIADPLCRQIRDDRGYSAAGINVHWFHEPGSVGRRQLVQGLCALSMPEDPARPVVRVEATEEKRNDWLTPYVLTHVTIAKAGEVKARLVSGHARPLARWPMPVMGCALNSSRPSWDCFHGFQRRSVGVGGKGTYGSAALEALAPALGLERAFAADRRAEIAANPPAFDRVVDDRIALSLQALDAVIADPTRRITVHDVNGLSERIDALGDRVPAIVATIGRTLTGARAPLETSRVLQGIVAKLPAHQFNAVAPALIAILNAQATLDDNRVEAILAVRLGNRGADAIPVLERLSFFRPRRPYTAALYGLCRVGPDAASLSERIATLGGSESRRDRDLETAIYVTLLRLGRADLIEREKAELGRFADIPKAVLARNITPASPPDVCLGAHGWPSVPS